MLDTLQSRIGYRFQNVDLLREALTHSVDGASSGGVRSNTRLAWLGDTVVDLFVSEALYRSAGEAHLAVLDRTRQEIVNDTSLARAAEALDVRVHLSSSQGWAVPDDQLSSGTALARAFEAVVGAVYLDGGPSSARDLIERVLKPKNA